MQKKIDYDSFSYKKAEFENKDFQKSVFIYQPTTPNLGSNCERLNILLYIRKDWINTDIICKQLEQTVCCTFRICSKNHKSCSNSIHIEWKRRHTSTRFRIAFVQQCLELSTYLSIIKLSLHWFCLHFTICHQRLRFRVKFSCYFSQCFFFQF